MNREWLSNLELVSYKSINDFINDKQNLTLIEIESGYELQGENNKYQVIQKMMNGYLWFLKTRKFTNLMVNLF